MFEYSLTIAQCLSEVELQRPKGLVGQMNEFASTIAAIHFPDDQALLLEIFYPANGCSDWRVGALRERRNAAIAITRL